MYDRLAATDALTPNAIDNLNGISAATQACKLGDRINNLETELSVGAKAEVDGRLDDLDTVSTGRVSVNEAAIAALEDSEVLHFEGPVGFADFDAEAGLQTLEFDALHATRDAWLVYVWIEKVTDFAGGTVNAATLEAGHDVGPDENAYVLAEDVFTGAGAGKVGFVSAERGVDQVAATYNPILPATQKLTVTMRTTAGDVAALTSGAAILHALYRLL